MTTWPGQLEQAAPQADQWPGQPEAPTPPISLPDHIPQAFLDRFDPEQPADPVAGMEKAGGPNLAQRILGAAIEGGTAGFGEGSLGLSPESVQRFRKLGIFNDPDRDQPLFGGIRFANEAVLRPTLSAIDAFFRGGNALLYGAGAVGGQVLAEASGANEAEQARARRDGAHLATTAFLLSAGNPVARYKRSPTGEVYSETIGGVPTAADFATAAEVIAGDKAPRAVQEKMLAAYKEKGLTPAEIAADAQTDPILAQRLLSSDVADVEKVAMPAIKARGRIFEDLNHGLADEAAERALGPLTSSDLESGFTTTHGRFVSREEALEIANRNEQRTMRVDDGQLQTGQYTREPRTKPLEGGGGDKGPPSTPEPPEPGSFGEAQKKILDKVSVGEGAPKEGWSWDKFYRQAIDDLHPLKKVDEEAYNLARLTRGQFGKAEHFIEYGTFDFNSYKTNGPALKSILEQVTKDLDGFRAYLTSKRAIEIEASGRKSGIDLEAAQRVAAEGEGKYGKAAADLQKYQENVLAYLRDSGVISGEAFTAMREAGQNYVPFYRVFQAEEGGGAGKSFGPGNPVKKLKGSERDIVDPLESIIKNTYAFISVAERNAVGIKLIDALKKEGEKVTVAKPKPALSREGGEAVVPGAPRKTYIADIANRKIDLPTVEELGKAIKAARDGEKKFAEASGFTAKQEARIQELNRIIDRGGRAADEAMAEKARILESVPDEGVDLNIADVDSLRQLRREFESLEKTKTESVDTYADGIVRVLKRYLVKATEGDDFAKAVFAKALSEAKKNGIDTKILSDETFKRYLGELSDGDRAFMEGQFRAASRPKITAEPKPQPYSGPDAELLNYLKENGVANPEKLADFVTATAKEDGTTLSAFRNGVKEQVQVKDPELVAAFRGLDQDSANLLTKVLALPAKGLRAGATLTPDFIARNIVRDFMTAFVNSGRGLFTPIDTIKGLKSAITKDADFQDWMKGGGANATMVALDRAYMQESLAKLNAETGLMQRSWNVVNSPIRFLRMTSELAENATRLGEFKKLRGEGKEAIQSAAFASREVTLDFARVGASMRAANMVTAFLNAQVQGLDRVGRAFVDRPLNTTAKVAGGITLPSVLLWWANHDDPRYKDLPHWQKDLFWIVMTKDHIYRIPKPFELGVVFGSGAERILDATIGQNPEAFDKFGKSIMDIVTPNILPTAAQPVLEQFANRSTMQDRTLIPQEMEKFLPEYQYTPYTTELTKKLGQIISAFPGVRGQAVGPGAPFGPIARTVTSPILLENYIRGWTGGLGMYAMQAADLSLRKAGVLPDPVTPTPTLADIPVVKAFMVRYPSATTQSIQDFYDQHEVTKKFYDTWLAKAKEGDTDAMARIQAAGGPMMFVRLDAIKDTLSEHSKLIRDIYKNPTVKAEEKRQLIDSLYFNMIEIGKAGKQMVRDSEAALKQATETQP